MAFSVYKHRYIQTRPGEVSLLHSGPVNIMDELEMQYSLGLDSLAALRAISMSNFCFQTLTAHISCLDFRAIVSLSLLLDYIMMLPSSISISCLGSVWSA